MTPSLIRENRILSALLGVSGVLNSSFDLEKNLSRVMHFLGDFLESGDEKRVCFPRMV